MEQNPDFLTQRLYVMYLMLQMTTYAVLCNKLRVVGVNNEKERERDEET